MKILVVTKKQLHPSYVSNGDCQIYFRSKRSGLKSLTPDILILGEGLTDEQEILALERVRGIPTAKIFDLKERT